MRWFVLTPGSLAYYPTPGAPKPKGIIPLQRGNVILRKETAMEFKSRYGRERKPAVLLRSLISLLPV